MAHDREVLRMIWEGQIGICFQADSEEIVGIKPEPFYLMVSRLSYLPLVTDKVNKTKQSKPKHEECKQCVTYFFCTLPGAKVFQPLHCSRASGRRRLVRFQWHAPAPSLSNRLKTPKRVPVVPIVMQFVFSVCLYWQVFSMICCIRTRIAHPGALPYTSPNFPKIY